MLTPGHLFGRSEPWPRGVCEESGPASCSAQRPWHFRISRPPCLNPTLTFDFCGVWRKKSAGKTDLKIGQSAARLRTGWEHLLPMEHSGQDRPRVRTSKVNFENCGFVRQDAVFKQDGRFFHSTSRPVCRGLRLFHVPKGRSFSGDC